jgi:anti-sigma factor RsiW
MKCERARDGVLLADSGELPVTGRLRLFFHLRGCPSCREYADELSRTTRAYRADSAAGVGERVTGAILDFAERERTRGARAAPAPAWRPAFAFAALALLLAAAGVLLLRAPGERKLGAAAPAQGWDDPVDEQIEQVNELVDVAAAEAWYAADYAAGGDDVDQVAQELLELEGEQVL